jgi:hypothetical protein
MQQQQQQQQQYTLMNSTPGAPKVQKNTDATPDALIELENTQTDRDIIAVEPLGGTASPSQDTML